jgi:hypothetical protein
MNARTASRLFLVASLVVAAVLSSLGRAEAPLPGTDLDDVPPGLPPEAEVAWVIARTPVIRVTVDASAPSGAADDRAAWRVKIEAARSR